MLRYDIWYFNLFMRTDLDNYIVGKRPFTAIISDPDFKENHQKFLESHNRFGFYTVNGLKIVVFPKIFHPTPQSSSVFFLNAVLAKFKTLQVPKKRILEIGCGTGSIGLSLNQYTQELYLSDIDNKAVLCSKVNAFINGIKANIFASNLFNSVPQQPYDVILFNMPILQKEKESNDELATCDPNGQLFRDFLAKLPDYLTPEGEVFFIYSNLGDLELLRQIPDCFKVERIASEEDLVSQIGRYAFYLKLSPTVS